MKKTIKILMTYVTLYIIMSFISVFFIRFEFDSEFNPQLALYNIKIARYYFITLPIASLIPVVVYYVFSRIIMLSRKKISDNCIIPSSTEMIDAEGFLNAMRNLSYTEDWTKISGNPQKALRYMMHYPDKFFIAKEPQQRPDWQDSFICERMIINGGFYYIYMKSKTFMVDLHNCATITSNPKSIIG